MTRKENAAEYDFILAPTFCLRRVTLQLRFPLKTGDWPPSMCSSGGGKVSGNVSTVCYRLGSPGQRQPTGASGTPPPPFH